jgi:hypothetical protein
LKTNNKPLEPFVFAFCSKEKNVLISHEPKIKL